MKKLLSSDWLRAVQFKCNTSAHCTSKFWIMIVWKTMGNSLSQWYHVKCWRKLCAETLKKVFSSEKIPVCKKIFRYFLYAHFFSFILLINNHTVFPVQFGIHLHLWVFQKAEIARAASASTRSLQLTDKSSFLRMPRKTLHIPVGLSFSAVFILKLSLGDDSFVCLDWNRSVFCAFRLFSKLQAMI